MTADALLDIKDLNVSFPGRGWRKPRQPVLRDVSLTISRGETLGLVGESGSGKTTLGRSLLGLVPVDSGLIRFEGREIQSASPRERRKLGRDLTVVFQDPFSSLNPSMTIEEILIEPLMAQGVSARDSRARIVELLSRVHLPADAGDRLAREFSGGQRQRIAIARALALRPKLIVCDEPVSALDLSTQATVLDLLIEIQEATGVAYLFISHDLSVVRHISHRVAVLYRGQLVETGPADEVTSAPRHPYTTRLLMSSPVVDPREQRERRLARARLSEAVSG